MKEAKEFIYKKLEECHLFVHEDYSKKIYHIWDKQLLRIKKLQRLSGNTNVINFKPNKNSIVLFEQDYNNNYFWYDYKNIYVVLRCVYNLYTNEINELMKDILNDDNKMKVLIPSFISKRILILLNDDNKMKALTPRPNQCKIISALNDDNKMKALTPSPIKNNHIEGLDGDDKIKYLTPAYSKHILEIKL